MTQLFTHLILSLWFDVNMSDGWIFFFAFTRLYYYVLTLVVDDGWGYLAWVFTPSPIEGNVISKIQLVVLDMTVLGWEYLIGFSFRKLSIWRSLREVLSLLKVCFCNGLGFVLSFVGYLLVIERLWSSWKCIPTSIFVLHKEEIHSYFVLH